ATTASTITQSLVRVREREPKAKRQALRDAIDAQEVKNAIVFCNRKRDVDVVARSLERHGYSASPIHGDLPQSERMATLRRFRDGELRLLVASDVAARGLDIPDVSHVFNYDPPNSPDDYVHRIGRTGRAGKKGASITIAGPEDAKKLKAIEDLLGGPIPPLDLKKGAKPEKANAGAEESVEAEEAPVDAAESEAGAAEERPAEKSGRRRRGRRSRGGRKPEGAPGTQAVEAAETPAPEPDEEDDVFVEPEDLEDIAEEPQLRRAESAPAPQRRGGGPLGFGDHVPAFVMRSVKERLVEVEA